MALQPLYEAIPELYCRRFHVPGRGGDMVGQLSRAPAQKAVMAFLKNPMSGKESDVDQHGTSACGSLPTQPQHGMYFIHMPISLFHDQSHVVPIRQPRLGVEALIS